MEQRLVLWLVFAALLRKSSTNLYAQDKRSDVVSKCIITEPKHGEAWQSVAKDPVNAYKSTEEILKIVANTIN